MLPVWSAQTRIELGDIAGSGAAAALQTLAELMEPQLPVRKSAVQVARAAYSRTGFEAAAVSAMGVFTTSFAPRNEPGVHRHALLRFGHPYAVVALALDGRAGGAGPWQGIPVFSAWVAEPQEPAG